MTPKYTGSAVALLAAVCAAPVAAQSADDIIVQTSRLPARTAPPERWATTFTRRAS